MHASVPAGPDAVMDVEPLAMAISDFFVRRSDYFNPALPNRLNILFSACPACDPDVAINDLGFRAIRVPVRPFRRSRRDDGAVTGVLSAGRGCSGTGLR